VGNRDRITLPDDLSEFVRPSDRQFEAASSHVRAIVPLYSVPWLVVTYDDLRAMPLEGRDGFVVSLVDGRATVEMILDMAGLPEDETIDVLSRLLRLGAIELRDPAPR
jgi:hypothetical protein